jgi:hypothetical protein
VLILLAKLHQQLTRCKMTKRQKRLQREAYKAYLRYICGSSLRSLARELGLTHAGLRYRFQRYIHSDFANLARRGIFPEIKRYLLSRHVSFVQKERIESWVISQLPAIVESEANAPQNFYSESKLNRLTRDETGPIDDYCERLGEVLWVC